MENKNNQNGNNNYNSNKNKQNDSTKFQENMNNWANNPYALDNPMFNKKEFRKLLVNMEPKEREMFINDLPKEFKESSRMPSLKSKTAVVIYSILGAVFPIIPVDRLYAGRILSGIIKAIAPLFIIMWGVLLGAFGLYKEGADTLVNTFGLIALLALIGTAVFWGIWLWVDVILSLTGKMKDKFGRKIDV